MLTRLLAALWRKAPKHLRRWGVLLTQTRFTVTTGAVVLDERRRVLLLNHVFRAGRNNAWGIPGGFIEKGEQPEECLRRELREEIGLELESVEIAFARTLKRPTQIEIIFRCRSHGDVRPTSREIKSAVWCDLNELPPELNQDQRRLIERALERGAEAGS